jgi:hypothetical protein
MRFFSIAAWATRTTWRGVEVKVESAALLAEDQTAAQEKAMGFALLVFDPANGWSGHQVVVGDQTNFVFQSLASISE